MIKKLLKFNKFNYIMETPDDFSPDKKYPIILFFHGAGGRGNNTDVLFDNPYFTQRGSFDLEAVTFAPQCYADSWFDIFEQLQDFVKYAINQEFSDKGKCYLMGASMGGYAVWQMAMTMPDSFAAIVPICGGGMYWNAGRLKDINVLAYHGSNDNVVFPEESKKMVDAVNKSGGNARLVICENVAHNSWLNVYTDKKVFDWLLSCTQKKYVQAESNMNDPKLFG